MPASSVDWTLFASCLGDGGMQRKLTQDNGESELEIMGNKSIPIEEEPDPVPVEVSNGVEP